MGGCEWMGLDDVLFIEYIIAPWELGLALAVGRFRRRFVIAETLYVVS